MPDILTNGIFVALFIDGECASENAQLHGNGNSKRGQSIRCILYLELSPWAQEIGRGEKPPSQLIAPESQQMNAPVRLHLISSDSPGTMLWLAQELRDTALAFDDSSFHVAR